MLKRTWITAAFLLSACVTVNIYFPAAAVERAADQIVAETWGNAAGQPPQKKEGQPQSKAQESSPHGFGLRLVGTAYAQEADINVSNPAIRALKDAMRNRATVLKPYMDKGNVGIDKDGLLTVRSEDGLNLKERAEIKQLVDAENRDREALYAEIAKANNIAKESIPKIKAIFAKSWTDQAGRGWWIQDASGSWKQK